MNILTSNWQVGCGALCAFTNAHHWVTGATFLAPVSGQSSMTEKEREKNLGKFRSGDVRVLVSTAALEEGIDVPNCQFVVR